MLTMSPDDPLALAVVAAIQNGDVETLKRLLEENPGLATARVVRTASGGASAKTSRTLLHVATDWPGHLPNGAETVAALKSLREKLGSPGAAGRVATIALEMIASRIAA